MAELAVNTARLIPDALLSCRQELSLPIDPVEYRRLYEAQQEAARMIMSEAARRSRDLVAAADSISTDSNQPK
jgi:hypothetical protein